MEARKRWWKTDLLHDTWDILLILPLNREKERKALNGRVEEKIELKDVIYNNSRTVVVFIIDRMFLNHGTAGRREWPCNMKGKIK